MWNVFASFINFFATTNRFLLHWYVYRSKNGIEEVWRDTCQHEKTEDRSDGSHAQSFLGIWHGTWASLATRQTAAITIHQDVSDNYKATGTQAETCVRAEILWYRDTAYFFTKKYRSWYDGISAAGPILPTYGSVRILSSFVAELPERIEWRQTLQLHSVGGAERSKL
jgi:hypothetical protein